MKNADEEKLFSAQRTWGSSNKFYLAKKLNP